MDLTGIAWHEIEKASFAVLAYVTPRGEPRSSGVVYVAADRRLYVAVAPDGWKARHIARAGRVAVTVPVRRGGLLTLMAPIPPATISFQAVATVHAPGTFDLASLSPKLASLMPHGAADRAALLELEPEGEFLTYGVGVRLMQMRDQAKARGRAAVTA